MEQAIKEAFSRVKNDIFSLGDELNKIKLMMADIKNEIKIITKAISDMKEEAFLARSYQKKPEKTEKIQENIPTHLPTQEEKTPTIQHITPTQEEIPTDKLLSQVLKRQNLGISTGNQGVPTNKQTNQQTNQHTNQHIIQHINLHEKQQKSGFEDKLTNLDKATEILESLDALKKELRLKIKRLTSQEMNVFSLIYSLENQGLLVDYQLLASKLQLSETSIRDYILKIQKKGLPISKEKLNNKKILLHLSQDLKKIASLDTILKLREL